MPRAATLIALAAILMSAPAAVHAAPAAGATAAEATATEATATEATTLDGEFYWAEGEASGTLQAVFTPKETAGEWDVAFHFEFRGKSHLYTGTAAGSLVSGQLSGTAQNENKGRTFTFTGKVAEGKFSGTHAETTEGRKSTGTLTLGG